MESSDRNVFRSAAAVLTSGWQQVNCSENIRGHFPFVVLLRLLDSISIFSLQYILFCFITN